VSDPGAGGETGSAPPDEPAPWAAPEQPAPWAAPDEAVPGAAPQVPSPSDGTSTAVAVAAPSADLGTPDPLPPTLRPLTTGDALDGAFALLRARPRAVLGIAALFVVPLQLVGAFLQRDLLRDEGAQSVVGDSSVQFGSSSPGSAGNTLGTFVVAIGMGLALTFICAAYSKMLAAWYGGTAITTREAITGSVKQAPSQLAGWFLVHLVAVPAACTGIGGFFLTPLYLVLAPVIAVERLGPIDGIRRAWFFGTKRYWGAFLVALLSGLAATLLSQAASAGLTVIGALLGEWGWLLLALGNSLAAIIGAVAVAGATALFYLEARVRLEGLDLVLASADAFPSDR
jgi:hypothetical protein